MVGLFSFQRDDPEGNGEGAAQQLTRDLPFDLIWPDQPIGIICS